MQNRDFIPEAEEIDNMMIHESQMINAEYDEEYFMAKPSVLKEIPLETFKEIVKAQPKIENQHLIDHRQYLGIDNHLKPYTISNSMISKTNYELAKQNGDQVLPAALHKISI